MLACCLGASSARANGFYIQEMSAASKGQAGAVAAAGQRPSSMYHNPANLAFVPGIYAEVTGTTYIPDAYYESPSGARTRPTTTHIFAPHAFVSWRVNDWLALGLSEFVDFGLQLDWPDDWEGRHLALSSGLQTVTINPNVAVGPFYGVVIGAGFDAKYGSFRLSRGMTLGMKPPGEEDVPNTLTLAGSGWDFGWNVGIMVQPADWIRVGLAWRSGFSVTSDDAKMDFDVTSPFAARFPDQTISGTLSLPGILMGGVRVWLMDDLSVELDMQWVQWSVFDTLVYQLSEGLELGPEHRQMVLEEVQDYRDGVQIRAGGQYALLDERLHLWLGLLYDQNPAPDHTLNPMLPDTDRVMPCVGLGMAWRGLHLDLAYMAVIFLDRTVTRESGTPLPGTYVNLTHNVTFTLGYSID